MTDSNDNDKTHLLLGLAFLAASILPAFALMLSPAMARMPWVEAIVHAELPAAASSLASANPHFLSKLYNLFEIVLGAASASH